MKEPTDGHRRFFAELKRRNVFRVVAVYGLVGFVVLQVVDLAVPALLLPEWTYRLVALLLLVGLPVTTVIAWAFEQTPAGIRRTDPADPAEIRAIIDAPRRDRWPAGALALAGLVLLGGGWWMGQRGRAEAESAVAPAELRLAGAEETRDSLPKIAVLRFDDMSPEGNQGYFSEGMSEEILNALVRIRGLSVVSRTSSFAYTGAEKDARTIGSELGAGYFVEGSVRKAGSAIRITVQLIDAARDAHLWSQTYDRELGDVFALQSDIAESIAAELRVPLGLDEGESLVSPTADLEAYDLYLAGRARMRERGDQVEEAIALFRAAIARDSSWAPAWAGLAESLSLVQYYGTDVDSAVIANSLRASEDAAVRALALDPGNASALVALGSVHRDRREWRDAESAYLRALSLDPENVEAHQQYAEYFSYVGRMDEAYRAAQRALRLDRSPIRINIAGLTAVLNGRYEEARDLLEEGIRADPEGRVNALRNNLRWAMADLGEWSEYRRMVGERLRELGRIEHLAELEDRWPPQTQPTSDDAEWLADAWSSVSAAKLFLQLGDPDRALEVLEDYYGGVGARDRSVERWRQLHNPGFDPIRDTPRFQALLRLGGLENRPPVRLALEGPSDD